LWGQAQIVRGGAFNNNESNARCAQRNRNQPDNHNNNIGFRVCASTLLPAAACQSV
jgi:formylglycine-generating enzyme required for sulfatase activity